MAVTREQVAAVMEREGDAIERIVAESPPVPAEAIAMLRAGGFPFAQNPDSVKSDQPDRRAS